MGTISDKLMRIINTKEDIRQALISKGYDVPTSIPFKEYAKMISDLPCRVDSFPDIEGIVARYSALGLTNEQMAANPVWVDKTGNGHDLQMKNFAWKEGSGISDIYPGALVFDGVDDYGACDNFPILTKEKGYTVVALRKWLTSETKTINEVLLGNFKNNPIWISANLGAFQFEVKYNVSKKVQTGSFGIGNNITLNNNHLFSYQISNSYNGSILRLGSDVGGNFFTVGCGGDQFYANAAIWELVFLDHDATEEELTKIKDYFVKTYPWLFPDQAWTVTGKTNEDEDRATIANITGDGNDLVLSNFGFAKGSGYGLYYQYFGEKFATTNGEIEDGGWNKIDNYNISHNKRIPINSIGECYWSNEVFANGIKLRFKLTGMTEGDVLAFGYAGTYDLTYTSDGIYVIDLPPVDKTYGFSLQSSLTENLPTTPVTIKLLPFEYEGYLVTDGVDDKVASVNAVTLNKDFTVVGEWRFKETEIRSNCGIVVERVLFVYNIPTGIRIYIHEVGGNFTELQNIKSLKAICSNGIVYDENWNPISVKVGSLEEYSNKLLLGYLSNFFTQIAFKNMSIYSNQLLSKDDCIKAYNYLQTLKAK